LPDASRRLPLASTPEAVLAHEIARLRADLEDVRSTLVGRVPVVDDTGWQNPSYVNGWVDYDGRTVQYRRTDGWVRFRGLMKNGTVGVNAFTLPAGYRPEFRGGVTGGMHHFPVAANAAFGLILVQNDGQVIFANGSNGWVDLSTVTYEADA
jgi:hypothetical protein